ncbi:MAG TPA: hypothetical protein VGB82_13130 [Alphaproteobacteria bacterium]
MDRTIGLREQAQKFRELAATDKSGVIRARLMAIAAQCEQLASSIEESAEARARTHLRVVPPANGGDA